MIAISRRLSGKDLSRQLSSVDEEHKRQLESGLGLSTSGSLRRQSSLRTLVAPGAKRASLASLQPLTPTLQEQQLADIGEKHSSLNREVCKQQTGGHTLEEHSSGEGDEVQIAYI